MYEYYKKIFTFKIGSGMSFQKVQNIKKNYAKNLKVIMNEIFLGIKKSFQKCAGKQTLSI